MKLVKDWMVTNLVSVKPTDSVFEAAKLMKKNKISSALVITKKALAGVVTERIILEQVVAKNLLSKSIKVEDIMDKNAPTLSPETTILETCKLLRDRNAKLVVIVDGKKTVGVISLTDIIKNLTS